MASYFTKTSINSETIRIDIKIPSDTSAEEVKELLLNYTGEFVPVGKVTTLEIIFQEDNTFAKSMVLNYWVIYFWKVRISYTDENGFVLVADQKR